MSKEDIVKHQITHANAAAMQAKGVEARKANKKSKTMIADAVRKELAEVQSNGKTKLENIVAKAIKAAFDNASTGQLKDLQAICGEEMRNINITGAVDTRLSREEAAAMLGIGGAAEEEGEE